ncbi:MAG TPA: hypothetical protein VNQ55_03305 [Parapedobacter sp.]|nr:hypothetical protein [Parapedobacter sp.]
MCSKVQSDLSYAGILWLLASFLGKDQRAMTAGTISNRDWGCWCWRYHSVRLFL